ncbi:MAG TPA: lamin tail domain-containing protein [Chitinivibrionales bacterium]|nr:lamin tail domain-containing protein [Chitinivibrionales bacterium]
MRARCLLIAVLLSCCLVHAGTTILLSENFEGLAAGWSLTGDWQIGTPTYVGPVSAYQGSRCAATNISGYYSANSNSILTSPVIQLPATATQITFSFFEWYYLESCCDYMYVELSNNGGLSWSTLRGGLNGYNQVWTQHTYDLTAYKNSSVQVRFRFTSDGSDEYPGWYIDSVTVAATVVDTANLPHIAVAPGSMRINATDPSTKTLTICNTGIGDTLRYSLNTLATGAINIVAWTYGAEMSYRYPYMVNAITSRLPNATVTATTTTDPATLAALLQNAQVFLIPCQFYSTPSYTYGQAFAPVLNNFLNAGGVVIALAPSTMTSFLSYAGLDTISAYSYATVGTDLATNPSHPVFDSVSTGSLANLPYTYYWTTFDGATVLATYSSYTVLSERKKGNGVIYLMGYDFYSGNAVTWGKILANCITKNISPTGGFVTADTTAGWVKAGSCKNVLLTFHREKMQPGTQVVQLRINHNALLDVNPVVVACTLSVDSTTVAYSAPSMSVTLFTGDTATRNATIQNTGSSLLNFNITKISKGTAQAPILINEIGIYYRFIELLNTGGADVNIGGWRLAWTDNYGGPGTYTFPAGTLIRGHRFVMVYASTGLSSDSLFYIGSVINWTYTSEMSVSLVNSSGQGVDFFKTSMDPTLPPSGTTWAGSGFVRPGSVYYYYRTSTVDNNSAADWAYSIGGYYWFVLNPGQTLGPDVQTGYISASADSLTLGAGSSSLIRFKYDASSLMTSGIFIDTFKITHNAKTIASPITVVCTLVVKSNIPVLIPYQPDPTINRKPLLQWHPVASASAYIVEVSQTSSFASLQLIQQTQDTFFQPLMNLPLGDVYWRVRCDLNAKPSLPDYFFIQNDSIPVLIPIIPDTVTSQAGMMFTWHKATGATSYKIQIYKTDTIIPQPIVITFAADTFYQQLVPLASGRYVWTVSANFDYNRLSYPDTFWVKPVSKTVEITRSKLPTVLSIRAFASSGRVMLSIAVPQRASLAVRPVSVDLFDVRGRLIGRVFDGMLAAGYYQFAVQAQRLASGMYVCRMQSLNEQLLTSVYVKK